MVTYRSTIKRKKFVDQGIKRCFKAGSSDQEPVLAIKNFDRRRRWKYRAYGSDYPLIGSMAKELALIDVEALVVKDKLLSLKYSMSHLVSRNS